MPRGNKEHRLAYLKRYNAARAEKTREYDKAYWLKNGDKRRAQCKEWRERNPGYKRPDCKVYRQMVIALLRQRDGDLCGVCGKPLDDNPHIDHIKPRCLGGEDVALNLRLTHKPCNSGRPRNRYEEQTVFGAEADERNSWISFPRVK
jgi:5-methylcytosine-specific restriction endonuclease McrA